MYKRVDPQKTGLGTKLLNLTFPVTSREQLIVIVTVLESVLYLIILYIKSFNYSLFGPVDVSLVFTDCPTNVLMYLPIIHLVVITYRYRGSL